MEPVVAHVNYQLQPVVVFDGRNWAMFQAAFENYARQQGFYEVLGDDGAEEPQDPKIQHDGARRWRKQQQLLLRGG